MATAAESLASAFTWKNNQVAPRMLGFKVKECTDVTLVLGDDKYCTVQVQHMQEQPIWNKLF